VRLTQDVVCTRMPGKTSNALLVALDSLYGRVVGFHSSLVGDVPKAHQTIVTRGGDQVVVVGTPPEDEIR